MSVKPTKPKRVRKKPAWGESVQSTEEQRELRERILFETAGKLFNKFGYYGTSMSQLTEALGLTKGALYYYVKDKSDLLYRLHMKSIDANQRAYDAGVAEGSNGYERVRGIIRHYVAAVTTSNTETFILLEEGALSDAQASEILEKRKKLELDLRVQIQSGIDDGSIVPCDPKMVSFALVGAMAWVSKWYEPGGDKSSEEVSQSLSSMLSRMISAAPVENLLEDSEIAKDAEA
jgi:AcrR family transcriptional regulator